MNAVLVMLLIGLFFYFVHRMHEQVGSYGGGHRHGDPAGPRAAPPAGEPPSGWSFASVLALTLVLLLPLMLLHAIAPTGSPFHPWLFWVMLFLPLLIVSVLLRPTGRRGPGEDARAPAEIDAEAAEWRGRRIEAGGPLAERVGKELEIEGVRGEDGLIVFEGRLRDAPEAAYGRLTRTLGELGRAPQLLEGGNGRTLVVAVPSSREHAKPVRQSPAVPLLLFAATLVTTTWAGALHRGVDLWQEPGRFAVGLPYALALMAILLVHELGHYVAGRLHGITVTLPYFIPVPMGLGTFGAFIQIRSAIPDRRKLFDVGVAGPLAGLLVALPALYLGLKGTVATTSGPGVSLSGSVLLAWLYTLANGTPVQPDHVVRLTPVGFAGWLGLLVTALNLIPVGQLDGGHVAYALFGRRRAETVGWVAFFLLVTLGVFYWSGWLTWAVLIFFLGGVKHEAAQNELPAPGWRRRAVGVLAFALLFLIMAPVPHRFMTALGVLCPYV